MTSLLNRLFGRAKRGSGVTAKSRLHFVLQHDRINLPPERAEEMKKEILAVIVKYLAVDQERVEIALEQRDRTHSKLVAEIPIANETYKPASLKREPAATSATGGGSNGAGQIDKDKPADETSEDAEEEKDHKRLAEETATGESEDDESEDDETKGDDKR